MVANRATAVCARCVPQRYGIISFTNFIIIKQTISFNLQKYCAIVIVQLIQVSFMCLCVVFLNGYLQIYLKFLECM